MLHRPPKVEETMTRKRRRLIREEDKNRPANCVKRTARAQRTPLDPFFVRFLYSRALKRKEKIGDFDPPKRGSFKEKNTKTKRTFYERTSFGIVQRVPESNRRTAQSARDPVVRTRGDGKRAAGGEQRRADESLEIGTISLCSIR